MKNMLKIDKTREEKNIVDAREYIVGMLALLFSIAVAWILVPKIVNYINPNVDISQVKILFNDLNLKHVCPEPVERATFMVSLILLPVLLLAFIFIFKYIFENITAPLTIKYFHNILFILLLGLIAYLAWISNEKNRFFYFYNSIGIGLKAIFFVVVISLLINLLILNSEKNHISNSFIKITSFLTNSICWIIILSVVLFNVYGFSLVNDMSTYTDNFNAVFHPVVQAFLGKEITYNLLSQYGLFPQILEPIWMIIGLNVFKFTLIMGFLMGISLVLLYRLFRELTDNKIIGYLGFISLVWMNYMFGRVIFMYRWGAEFADPTFQHFPIRFVFIILSIYFTYLYLKTSSKKIYYLSFMIYPISMVWNFDTGIIIYLTWLITLVYKELCNRDIKKILLHAVNWFLFLLLTIGLFTLYMFLRYGHTPLYEAIFLFQKVYFICGFFMLPMPIIHPWNLVIIIYLIGMAISLVNLLNGNKSIKVFMIFNISIVGTGVFAYYQGRSHDFNLAEICYPAFLLIAFFADELIKKIRDQKNIINFIALNYITFFMIFCSMSLIKNYKIIFTTIRERVKVSIKGENTPVIRSAEFIKNNTKRGEEVLLLSNLSGIYCLESQTTSPIKIVPLHIVLNSETNDVLSYLNSNACERVFLDVNFREKAIWDFVQTNFKLSLVSPDRNIGLFIK